MQPLVAANVISKGDASEPRNLRGSVFALDVNENCESPLVTPWQNPQAPKVLSPLEAIIEEHNEKVAELSSLSREKIAELSLLIAQLPARLQMDGMGESLAQKSRIDKMMQPFAIWHSSSARPISCHGYDHPDESGMQEGPLQSDPPHFEEHSCENDEVVRRWGNVYSKLAMMEHFAENKWPTMRASSTKSEDLLLKKGQGAEIYHSRGCVHHFMSRPMSWRWLLWEALGVTLVTYDLISFPMFIAFSIDQITWMAVLNQVTTTFWVVDLVFRFFHGYYRQDGVLEMRLTYTARKYLKTGFPFDFVVVCLDVIWSTSGDGAESAGALRVFKLGKLGRLLRAVRAVRLLRMRKYNDQFEELLAHSSTADLRTIALKFVRLMFIVLAVNHLLACFWWGIGNSGWVQFENFVDANKLEERTLPYKYLTCLHWAVTQFTPASMEVHPENSYERVFAICVVMFGMVAFSACISQITGLTVQLRNYGHQDRARELQLRKFLKQNHISLGLTNQIWSYIKQNRASREARLAEDGVQLLDSIPSSLRFELHTEIYLPVLAIHPLFNTIAMRDSVAMQHICNSAVRHITLLEGHELFHKGSACLGMIFVSSGSLLYSLTKPTSFDLEEAKKCALESQSKKSIFEVIPEFHVVGEEAWIAEAALWLPAWFHRGWLAGISLSELFVVNPEKFHFVFSTHHHKAPSTTAVQRYSAYFKDLFLGHSADSGNGHGEDDLGPVELEVEDLVRTAFPKTHTSSTDSLAFMALGPPIWSLLSGQEWGTKSRLSISNFLSGQ